MIKASKKNITLLSTMLMGPISLSLLIISIYLIQPQVEAKLTSNVQSVLKEHNISADVSFSGRDGVLKGEVDSKEMADNAEKLSLSVFGTRIIHNQLNVKSTELINPPISMVMEEADAEKDAVITPTIKVATKHIEAVITPTPTRNDGLSDIDKIMANMQKASLVNVINTSKQPVTEVSKVNTSDIKNNKTLQNTPRSETQKSENESKPKLVLAVFTEVDSNKTQLISKKDNPQSKDADPLLDIIDDFNAYLTPQAKQRNEIDTEEAKLSTTTQDPILLEKIDLSLITFSENSSTLLQESYATLDQLSESIKNYYHAPIDITNYAKDSDIAYARGVAIRDYLVGKGIVKSNIGVAGHTITADTKNSKSISIKLRQ